MKLRLDKYLADMGIGTRTEVKKAITKGQVRVNEETVKRPEIKIDTEKDHVFYQGQRVAYAEYEYYMLNKPAGVVSATEDKNDSTVLDLIDEKQRKDLFPVGRLDKDTEGLLLITNDGELAHQLLSPKKHVDKVYFARIDGKVTEEDVRRFAEGLEIGEEKPTLPAHLEILKSEEISEIRLTIREGKFHQVKRMFHVVGKEVIYLKRLQMGSLVLDPRLALGEYRELSGQELKPLRDWSLSRETGRKHERKFFTNYQRRDERERMGSGRFCLCIRRCLCRSSIFWSRNHYTSSGIQRISCWDHCTAGLA